MAARKSKKELAIIEKINYLIIKRSFANLEDDDIYDASDWQTIPIYYDTMDEAMVGLNTYQALLSLSHPVISNPEELWNNINFIGVIPEFQMVLKHIIEDGVYYEAICIEKYSFQD